MKMHEFFISVQSILNGTNFILSVKKDRMNLNFHINILDEGKYLLKFFLIKSY